MSTGKKIAEMRKSKGISQELLAENAGVSLRTIQRIESGSSVPRPFTLKVIADNLGVPVEQITTASDPTEGITSLRLINLSCLAVVLFPGLNILIPFLLWRKYRIFPFVDTAARRAISFQILWTIAVIVVLAAYQVIYRAVTGSAVSGRFSPLPAVYLLMLVLNVAVVLWSAIRLGRNHKAIYSFCAPFF